MEINFLAVFVAALAAFFIGGLWYSPLLFQKPWMAANRFTDSDLTGGNMIAIFGGSFVLSLVMAANLAAFLDDPSTTTAWGATAGFLAGFGWVALGIGVVALFERRPLSYTLINGGYWTVTLTAMGAILGAWR
jgi:hypothetical protein